MHGFKSFHPLVNFVYFVAVIGFSMVFLHPLYLLVSLTSAFVFLVLKNGTKAVKTNLLYVIPVVLITAVLNPLFNHQGATVIAFYPNGNPLTREALIFGFCSGVMIACVICWFSCYNQIMTSDKFIYLFGRVIPTLSLVVSMTLRFVPDFIKKFRQTADVRKTTGDRKGKLNTAVKTMSAVITRSLEGAMETSDSMCARGYGVVTRTAFSIYRFDRRDGFFLGLTVVLAAYIIAGGISGAVYFNFYPVILYADVSAYSISVIAAYFILCFMPVITELWEVIKWKHLTSKI